MSQVESRRGMEGSAPVPKVIFDPALSHPDVPYTVSVDDEACGKFLEFYGMKQKKIPTRTIELRRTISPGYLGLHKGKRMILACDPLWRKLTTEDRPNITINNVFQHEAKHAIDHTRITTSSIDRGYKLLAVSGSEFGLLAFNLLAFLTSLPIISDVGIAVGTGLIINAGILSVLEEEKFPRIYPFALPWEKRAMKFGDKVRDDPQWQSLVTLTSKNPE